MAFSVDRGVSMMRKFVVGFSVAALSLGLAGCSSVGPSFNDMTKAYTASIEQHTRDTILINMMRAAYDMPMTFTDIPSVLGTGSVGSTTGLSVNAISASPGSVAGYFSAATGSYYTTGLQLNTSRQFNFTLSSLDNQQFTKGFLTTIPLENVHFFSRSSHLSKQLLYTLLVDSIEIKVQGGHAKRYVNDPKLAGYDDFQKLLRELLASGLTTETVTQEKAIGPKISQEQAVKLMPEMGKVMMGAKSSGVDMSLKPSTSDGRTMYQLHAQTQQVRFCVAPPPEQTWIRERFGPQILCNPDPGAAALGSVTANTSQSSARSQGKEQPVEVMTITLRSTRDVFRFIGQVIMVQTNGNPPFTVTIPTEVSPNTWKDIPLLVLNKGSSPPSTQTIASTEYFGESYSVPLNDNGYSSVVFDLLSLLVTMNKIPGSIPASPGILIK